MAFFKNLFKEGSRRDVITLFHAPSNPASMRVHTLLKQTAATAHSHATEDQATSHANQSKLERTEFDLDVSEVAPTNDQLNSILEYVGSSKIGTVVADATSVADAMKKFKASENSFVRPVTVDWNNGRAVIGDNESEILKLIKSLPKETDKV